MAKTRKSSEPSLHNRTTALDFTGASGMPCGMRLLDQPGISHRLIKRWGDTE